MNQEKESERKVGEHAVQMECWSLCFGSDFGDN